MNARDMLLIGYLIVAVVIYVAKSIDNATTYYVLEPTPPSVSALFWPMWVVLVITYLSVEWIIHMFQSKPKAPDHD